MNNHPEEQDSFENEQEYYPEEIGSTGIHPLTIISFLCILAGILIVFVLPWYKVLKLNSGRLLEEQDCFFW